MGAFNGDSYIKENLKGNDGEQGREGPPGSAGPQGVQGPKNDTGA